MRLDWKVTIHQENLAPEYKGSIELTLKGIQGTFTFHYKLDPGYRITADDNPFLAFSRNGESYLKVRLPVSQCEYGSLPDEKQVMLSLMEQMVRAGVKKIRSEHNLNSLQITSAILSAAQSTLHSKKEGSVEVADKNVCRFIQEACKMSKKTGKK